LFKNVLIVNTKKYSTASKNSIILIDTSIETSSNALPIIKYVNKHNLKSCQYQLAALN